MTVVAPRVADKVQAALLLQERYADVLGVLAVRNRTAMEVAQAVGRPLSSVHSQLQLLLEAGVITVNGERPRAGRAMREYHLPLPWRIPFTETPAESLRELLAGRLKGAVQQQMEALAQSLEQLYDSSDWFVQLQVSGGVLRQQVQHEGLGRVASQPFLGVSTVLALTPERAAALKERLEAVLAEFQEESHRDEAAPWGLLMLLTPP